MSIRIHCSRCFRLTRVNETQAGSKVSCPDCQAKILVPTLQPPLALSRGGVAESAGSGLAVSPGKLIGLTCAGAVLLAVTFALIPSGDSSGVLVVEQVRVKYETPAATRAAGISTPSSTGMTPPPGNTAPAQGNE